MNEMTHRPSIEAPQLRTLLLTDLCDSTALVERIGDVAAATLFRDHDRLVLDLQQRWRGRLIDRSDGLLLLFERPIDGLGFALDYVRGLREMSASRRVDLKARAGLHVGEVLTWRNSEEAVLVGAKPLEVEGLAKPMAARLMAMARPGQILLSAVAEPLAHRAARELGERGQHLLWKSHGRWRFKGVPDSQQIYEVGEPGIAPLRAPPNTPKSWRDIPLWRRPAALAAEAAVIAGIGVGVWFATRPAPAIAFNQRDWVVVADLRNLTGQTVLDDSLEQAFRTSLEQSRYVNVLSELKTRDTLERMKLEPDLLLDRAVASEVALRDGARAVILPTVAEVGGKLRVSAEVIDPSTQGTVYTELVDGAGIGSALGSIDDVTANLRAKLGEAMESIDKDSQPLPQVTTGSLDALRAYALGNKASSQGQWREAKDLYERAVSIDPSFALAYAAIARVYVALSDRPAAVPYLDKALALKDRLTERDRLYLDAWSAELRLPGKALARWKLLASLYPDQQAGPANASWQLYQLNEFEASKKFAEAANLPQGLMQGVIIDQIGRVQLAQGNAPEAWNTFLKANRLQNGVSLRRQASVLAVQERHEKAEAIIESMTHSGYASSDLVQYIDRTTLAIDKAQWAKADRSLREALARSSQAGSSSLRREFSLIATAVKVVQQPKGLREDDLRKLAQAQLTALERPDNPKVVDDAFMALVAAYMAQRAGHGHVADNVLAALQKWEGALAGTVFDKMLAVVKAENDRIAGRTDAAIRRLQGQLDGAELVQTHVALRAALDQAGRHEEALRQAEWLLQNRGRAYMESNAAQVLQALNVLDTRMAHLYAAEALAAAQSPAPAAKHVADLLEVWPREQLPDYLRRRTDSILPASKAKTTL